jgi:hypothetical protein
MSPSTYHVTISIGDVSKQPNAANTAKARELRDQAQALNPTPPEGSRITIVDNADGKIIERWKGFPSGWVKLIEP